MGDIDINDFGNHLEGPDGQPLDPNHFAKLQPGKISASHRSRRHLLTNDRSHSSKMQNQIGGQLSDQNYQNTDLPALSDDGLSGAGVAANGNGMEY